MKAKKLFIYLGILVLGSIVAVAIDHLVGVNFDNVGFGAQLVHKVTYMLWGVGIVWTGEWLDL